jgi:hypothetical protein
MLSVRQILHELRAPFLGLLALALVASSFASSVVASARASNPAWAASHCLSTAQDGSSQDEATKDALCKLCCAVGAASVALDSPPHFEGLPAPFAGLVVAYMPTTYDVASYHLIHAGGGSRAPPIPA